jgi:hypothetical protein
MHFMTGEIHIKVTVGESKTIWICGDGHHESLKHALVYLDTDIDFSRFPNDDEKIGNDGVNYGNSSYTYIPGEKRILWTKKKYVNNECKAIEFLPKGTHILSIAPNSTHEAHITKLSHVIMWP